MLDEHYNISRAFLRWDGQRHTSFSTYSTRLLLFDDWPKASKPAPETLNAAGFFHLCRGSASYDYLKFCVDSATFLLLFVHITNAYRSGRQYVCCHCCDGLQDWLHTDDPWTEDFRSFPYCIYVRYMHLPIGPLILDSKWLLDHCTFHELLAFL